MTLENSEQGRKTEHAIEEIKGRERSSLDEL